MHQSRSSAFSFIWAAVASGPQRLVGLHASRSYEQQSPVKVADFRHIFLQGRRCVFLFGIRNDYTPAAVADSSFLLLLVLFT
jgi:hypothetical protein